MRQPSSRRSGPLSIVLALAMLPAFSQASQSKVWVGEEQDFERFLTHADIVRVEEVGSGVNQPKRVTLRRDGREIDALWKPIQRGPKEWAWESFEAEVAAYRLDRMLGLHMVPPTVVRSIDDQDGSLQLWINDVAFFEDKSADAPDSPAWHEQLHGMKLFDNLIGNGDRSATNILVDEQWNAVLIDHSQAFVSSHYLLEDDEKLPQRFDRRLVARLKEWDLEHLRFRFGRLLLEPQIRAILMRRDGLLRRVDALIAEKGEAVVLYGAVPEPE